MLQSRRPGCIGWGLAFPKQRLWLLCCSAELENLYLCGSDLLALTVVALLHPMDDAKAHVRRAAQTYSPAVVLKGPLAVQAVHAVAEQCCHYGTAVQGWQLDTELCKEVVHEPKDRAVSAGAGILVTAVTSTGLILGRGMPAERGRPAQDIGKQAASELLGDLHSGACVDEWCVLPLAASTVRVL